MAAEEALKVPGVTSVVIGDMTGSVIEAAGEADNPENVAAVMGFVASNVAQAGESLGLGGLRGLTVSGKTGSCVVTVAGDRVAAASVDPSKPLQPVEKALEAAG